MPNIRDVAARAGVSIATVSRILSEDTTYRTRPETRERVYQAVDELGYQYRYITRDPKVGAPSSKRIGCVLAETVEKYSDPYFTSILSALENRMIEHGYVISAIRNLKDLMNPKVLEETFSQGLCGLVLMEQLPDEMYAYIKEYVPYIVGCDTQYPELDNVGVDNFRACFTAFSYLLDRGYRRICYMGGASLERSFHETIPASAIHLALSLRGIPFDPDLIVYCGWDLENCAEETRRMLDSAHPPDAFFDGSDSMASVILNQAHNMGRKVPDEVGVVGINNTSFSAYTIPPLTTISIPTQDIGIATADRLVARMNGDTSNWHDLVFSTELIVRASTR